MKFDFAFLQHSKIVISFQGVLHRPHVTHHHLHRPAAAQRAAHSAPDVRHATGFAALAPADRLTAAAATDTETLRGQPYAPSHIIWAHPVAESAERPDLSQPAADATDVCR